MRRAAIAVVLCAVIGAAQGATEQDVLARIDQMRAMPAVPATVAAGGAQRNQLDQLWRYFGDNKADALPVLRRELAAELRQARPKQLVLMDLGYFLQAHGHARDKALSMQALLALDPASDVIAPHEQHLFRFVHAAAQGKDRRLLPLIDKVFLRGKVKVYIPQHGYTVDESSVCAYLYGLFGKEGEAHLRGQLGDPTVADPALEVLMWTGSPDSVAAVSHLLSSSSPETFARAVTFLMRAGGPQGRAALQAVDVRKLEGKARDFFLPLREQVQAMSLKSLREQLQEGPATAAGSALSDDQMRMRLDEVENHYGRYERIQPLDIAWSRLPKQELIERALRIRERSFLRVSDEALADIDATNSLLNVLYFRNN